MIHSMVCKHITSIHVLLMLFCLTWGNTSKADSIIVNVTGNILPSPCTVQTIPDVNLNEISDVQMQKVGNTSSPVDFRISLIGCPPNIKKATVTFTGLADLNNNGLFRNTAGSGAATGLGIELLDGDHNGVRIIPGGTSQVMVSNASATFNLKARAVTTVAAPVTGNIDANITVSFTYQ
ncbi:hypothetical protein VL10_14590 [Leclercia adecarboxylata]|nr:hypothetical protein VL10_14590 [Leclercia adecarboxylata]KMN63740.1 hypothetical protein VK95_18820 [Leclercia sp. LK8]